jgi:leader peptidase (prepilin peptidase)/N-methyltransferase
MSPPVGVTLVLAAAVAGGLVSAALHRLTVRRFLCTRHARQLLGTRRALLVSSIVGAVLCGAAAWCVGAHPILVPICVLAVLAPALGMVDVVEQRLPNVLTVGSYPILVALLGAEAALSGDWPALLRAAAGFVALPAFYLAIAAASRGGFGAGDMKLAAAAGLVLGYRSVTSLAMGTLAALVCGAVMGLAMLAARGATRHDRTPYGPALLVGTLLAATV